MDDNRFQRIDHGPLPPLVVRGSAGGAGAARVPDTEIGHIMSIVRELAAAGNLSAILGLADILAGETLELGGRDLPPLAGAATPGASGRGSAGDGHAGGGRGLDVPDWNGVGGNGPTIAIDPLGLVSGSGTGAAEVVKPGDATGRAAQLSNPFGDPQGAAAKLSAQQESGHALADPHQPPSEHPEYQDPPGWGVPTHASDAPMWIHNSDAGTFEEGVRQRWDDDSDDMPKRQPADPDAAGGTVAEAAALVAAVRVLAWTAMVARRHAPSGHGGDPSRETDRFHARHGAALRTVRRGWADEPTYATDIGAIAERWRRIREQLLQRGDPPRATIAQLLRR